ncbi:MAG: potassium uptake protein, TrkH family [Firmicutes bacterium]|nr:potassium uptake protein, TrkH family [Bacillota bacterium]
MSIIILRQLVFRKKVNPARRIAFGFAALILAGALILTLPISTRSGNGAPFLTALFIATSATCVTGLSLVNVGAYFSLFGQAVILALIQLGGLGFVTVFALAFFVSDRQIGLSSRIVLAQSMGEESLAGIVKTVKHVLYITGAAELLGALLLMIRFIPRFGVLKGIWFGIFHSVSAFCNAGFDIIGDGRSVAAFYNDPLVLLTLAALIITGGLGFAVWEDIIRKKSLKRLTAYSKTVLVTTAALIVFGTLLFFALEYNNGATMGGESGFQKILSSFFQSVTTRTAGFDSVTQDNLTDLSKTLGVVLMMIGGASGSTAGGIKVGTAALIILTLRSVLRSRDDVTVFGRSINRRAILHAMSIFTLWLMFTITGAALVSYADGAPMLNSVYEVASAYSTVGLTVGITETASVFTKILLMIYMFFGRVGIMTVSVVFMTRLKARGRIKYPEGRFIVG